MIRKLAKLLLFFLLTGIGAHLSAQQVATTGTATAAEPDDEIVSMETFNIVASSDVDPWTSSQAMSGSRTAENIVNLPYQIQVVTAEFLQDFDLQSVADQLESFAGMSVDANTADPLAAGTLSGNARFRGFRPLVLRDGFQTSAPAALSSTRQVEVIKGPMSTLYGLAQPGGIINYISRQPSSRPSFNTTLAAGNYDYWRVNATLNQPLVRKKLYIQAIYEQSARKGEKDYEENETRVAFARALWKPFRNTNITVSYERLNSEGRRGEAIPLGITTADEPRSITDAQKAAMKTYSSSDANNWDPYNHGYYLAGVSSSFLRWSHHGPNEWYERNYDFIQASIEQRLGRSWKFRATYLWMHKTWEQDGSTGGAICVSPGYWNFRSKQPYVREQDYDMPYAFQTELAGNFRLGKTRHAVLLLLDTHHKKTDESYWRLPATVTAGDQTFNPIPYDYYYMNPSQPAWTTLFKGNADYADLWPGLTYDDIRSHDREVREQPGGWRGARSRLYDQTYEDTRSSGVTASERMFLLNEHLVLMASIRYDTVDYKYYDATGASAMRMSDPGWDWSHTLSDDGVSYSFGANLHFFNNRLIFFGNYSTSVNTNPLYDRGTRQTTPNETGRGTEFGIRTASPGGSIQGVLSAFEIQKSNMHEQNPEYYYGADGTPEYMSDGVRRVRGLDLEFSWRPSKKFVLQFSGAWLDAKILDSGTPANPIGAKMRYVPEWTANAAVRYTFGGFLRGFSTGASVNYNSGWINTYEVPPNVDPGTRTPGQPYWDTPGYEKWSAWLRYEWRVGKTQHRISFNATDIFDRYVKHIPVNRWLSLGRRFTVSYNLIYR